MKVKRVGTRGKKARIETTGNEIGEIGVAVVEEEVTKGRDVCIPRMA
jgi:hypothetical protein